MSIQAKVLLPLLAMLVVLLGSTLWLVNQRISGEFRAAATQSLATADAIFQNSEKIRIKNLLLRFRTVPNEPRFKAVSQLGDPATTHALLTELLNELGADAALFTGPEGNVLACATRHSTFRREEFESASAASIHQTVMDGEPNVDLIGIGGDLFEAISVPSIVGDQLVGVLTFGVEMGESVAQEFKQLTDAEVMFLTKDRIVASTVTLALPLVGELTDALARLAVSTRGGPDFVQEITMGGEHFLGVSGRLASLGGENQLRYVLLSSQEQHLSVLRSTQRRIVLIGVVGIALSTAILWSVIRGATRPLRQLRDAAEKIGRGDFSSRVPVTSRDECGELATVFNQMAQNLSASRTLLQEAHDGLERHVEERTSELREEITRRERAQAEAEESHRQLVGASRMAGMAEVATNVLHNVGNVLNSVNVSTTILTERTRTSRTGGLTKVVAMLSEHSANLGTFLTVDAKGKFVPEYLTNLAALMEEDRLTVVSEIDSLRNNIEHIKNIVAMQQSYARAADVLDDLLVSDLLEDALSMNEGPFGRHGITIRREFRDMPTVRVDKHKVMQVLVNLLRNARQAMDDTGRTDKVLTVSLARNGDDLARIIVCDNGVGIAPENLTRIFQHGFTTKRDGHGFGLHSAALAAKEMGGRLCAESEGLGKGASFTLELPLAPQNGNTLGLASNPLPRSDFESPRGPIRDDPEGGRGDGTVMHRLTARKSISA